MQNYHVAAVAAVAAAGALACVAYVYTRSAEGGGGEDATAGKAATTGPATGPATAPATAPAVHSTPSVPPQSSSLDAGTTGAVPIWKVKIKEKGNGAWTLSIAPRPAVTGRAAVEAGSANTGAKHAKETGSILPKKKAAPVVRIRTPGKLGKASGDSKAGKTLNKATTENIFARKEYAAKKSKEEQQQAAIYSYPAGPPKGYAGSPLTAGFHLVAAAPTGGGLVVSVPQAPIGGAKSLAVALPSTNDYWGINPMQHVEDTRFDAMAGGGGGGKAEQQAKSTVTVRPQAMQKPDLGPAVENKKKEKKGPTVSTAKHDMAVDEATAAAADKAAAALAYSKSIAAKAIGAAAKAMVAEMRAAEVIKKVKVTTAVVAKEVEALDPIALAALERFGGNAVCRVSWSELSAEQQWLCQSLAVLKQNHPNIGKEKIATMLRKQHQSNTEAVHKKTKEAVTEGLAYITAAFAAAGTIESPVAPAVVAPPAAGSATSGQSAAKGSSGAVAAAAAGGRTCSACKTDKPRTAFSAAQLKKAKGGKASVKCKVCVGHVNDGGGKRKKKR